MVEDQLARLARLCTAALAQLEATGHELDELMLTAAISERAAWERMEVLAERVRGLHHALEGAFYAWTCPN